MRSILSLIFTVSYATGFVSRPPMAFQAVPSTTKQFMFSTDDNATPKVEVPPLALESDSTAAAAAVEAKPSEENAPKTTLVRNMNTGEVMEVKWSDPAMMAHTQPWKMDWWAYILFSVPFILLADDAFHFLPKDGPLGFLVH